MKKLAVVLALALPLSVLADDKTKAELKNLQGSWTITSIEAEGKKQDFPKGTLMKIDGDKITIVTEDGKTLDESVLMLDPSKSPKVWDVKQDGKVEPGIYKLEGNNLTICTTKNKDRPAEFKSGPGVAVLTMTRKK